MTDSEMKTINREACAWIAKLHDGDPTPEDLEALQAWANRSPMHHAELRRMAKRWEELNVLTELAVPGTATAVRETPPRITRRWGAVGAIAAALAVAVVFIWQPFEPTTSTVQPAPVYTTAVGQQRLVTLPDNSTVLLNTNSQLHGDYSSTFRSVYLIHGEAHFDVQPESTRPFRVFAGNGLFRAVGTAFSVRLKEQTVELTVTEGRVAISKAQSMAGSGVVIAVDDEQQPVVSAGQVAVYDQFVDMVESIAPIDQREISRKLAWKEGQLQFLGEPLSEVVSEVSRYTSLSIVILDPALRDLRIGGNFEVGETDKLLEALQSGFNIRVERIDHSLVHLSHASQTPPTQR